MIDRANLMISPPKTRVICLTRDKSAHHHQSNVQSLLQYNSFEMKMEGYNSFLALSKLKSEYFICIYNYAFFHELGKMSQICVFGGVHPEPSFTLINIFTRPILNDTGFATFPVLKGTSFFLWWNPLSLEQIGFEANIQIWIFIAGK